MKNLKIETQKQLIKNHLLGQISACKGKVDINFMNILGPTIDFCKKEDAEGWEEAFPEIFSMPAHEYVIEHYADEAAFELVDMVVRTFITNENWGELYVLYYHFGDHLSSDILYELDPNSAYKFVAM